MKMRRSQRGATLIVALILLVMLTLFGLSAFQTGSTNVKITGNMQARTEAQNAAQQVIDKVISSQDFTKDPLNALANPCGDQNTACVDVTGRGGTDYTVRLVPAPRCIKAAPITNNDLDVTNPVELPCASAQPQQFGVAGLDNAAGNSLCANTVWDVTAEATDTKGTVVTVSQGINVSVFRDEVLAFCQ